MEDRLIHSAAVKLADRLNRYAHREGKDYLRLVYGLEVYVMNIIELIIIFTVTWLTGMIVYTLAALVGFNVIRRSAHGMHAKSSRSCTLTSMLLFIVVPYLLKDFAVNNLIVLPVFGVIILLLFLYAPADTASKPLVGPKKRARLKKQAVISGILLMVGVLLIGDGVIKTMLTLGAVCATVSILPISYRMLKKNYSNYMQYENPVGV